MDWLTDEQVTAGVANALRGYETRRFHYTLTMPLHASTADHLAANIRRAAGSDAHLRLFGSVLNTDERADGRGLHWVGLLVNTKACTIQYFDPMGALPSARMWELLHRLNRLLMKYRVTPHLCAYVVNAVRFQRDTHNCGVLAIWFLEAKVVQKIAFCHLAQERHQVSSSKLAKLRSAYLGPAWRGKR